MAYRYMTPDDDEEVLRLAAQGLSAWAIAQQTKHGFRSVVNVIARGIPRKEVYDPHKTSVTVTLVEIQQRLLEIHAQRGDLDEYILGIKDRNVNLDKIYPVSGRK